MTYFKQVLLPAGLQAALVLAMAVLFMLPYWLSVHPIAQGVGIVPFGKESPLWQVAILWGFHVALAGVFLFWAWRRRQSFAMAFTVVLILVGFLLIILPEIIFIRDIYPTHFRANTMFKFYYQAWVMLGVALPFTIVTLWQGKGFWHNLYRIVTGFLILGVLIYPVIAVSSGITGGGVTLTHFGVRKSLDGTAYLKTLHQGDAQAIDWINAHIQDQPVMVEAVGDSYTDYARVAANTGLQTVMGWPVHEWLWRGSYSDPIRPTSKLQKESGQTDSVGTRVEDVKRLYETKDANEAFKILQKYHVDYIYVGELERTKYPALNVDKLAGFARPVYQTQDVTIFGVYKPR